MHSAFVGSVGELGLHKASVTHINNPTHTLEEIIFVILRIKLLILMQSD